MIEFDLNSEEIDRELQIDDSSVATLVLELKNNSRKAAKYLRWAAQVNKQLAELNLQMEILISTIVDEGMLKSGSNAASMRQELRKTAAKDPRYQDLRRQIIDAEEKAGLLNGLSAVWTARGFRLKEIVSITDRSLYDSPRILTRDLQHRSDETADKLYGREENYGETDS